jgi:hypothetical protein
MEQPVDGSRASVGTAQFGGIAKSKFCILSAFGTFRNRTCQIRPDIDGQALVQSNVITTLTSMMKLPFSVRNRNSGSNFRHAYKIESCLTLNSLFLPSTALSSTLTWTCPPISRSCMNMPSIWLSCCRLTYPRTMLQIRLAKLW